MIYGSNIRSLEVPFAVEFNSSDRAMLFSQIMWSVECHIRRKEQYEKEYHHDGKWWMKDTDASWAKWGPWKSERSWKRDKKWLKDSGWIFVEKLNKSKWDHTSFISVNWEKVQALRAKDFAANNVLPDEAILSSSGQRHNVPVHDASSSPSSLCTTSQNYQSPDLDRVVEPKASSRTISDPGAISTEVGEFKPKKSGGVYKAKAPKIYVPTISHIKLAEGWKEQIKSNIKSQRETLSDRDLAYQMSILLDQTYLSSPQMTAENLELFIQFLARNLDANPKRGWKGWGAVFQSIPQGLKARVGEQNKLEKAWASFGEIYKQEFKKHTERQELSRQKEAEKALGIELPF